MIVFGVELIVCLVNEVDQGGINVETNAITLAQSSEPDFIASNVSLSNDLAGQGSERRGVGSGECERGRNVSTSMNRTNRNRLPPIIIGESYPCGCGVCDKQYINNGNVSLCYGCKNMYVNKACNREWKCMSCKQL